MHLRPIMHHSALVRLDGITGHLRNIGRQFTQAMHMSPVSTHETNSGSSRKEDFWFIVAARSEDEWPDPIG